MLIWTTASFGVFDEHLSSVRLKIGFKRLISDSEVFTLTRGSERVILTKHVDDILLAGTRGTNLLSFVSAESSKIYTMTTSIEPSNFVGLSISRDRSARSITISQPNYTASLIDKFSAPSSSAKYPMTEHFLINMPVSSPALLLSLDLQTLFQEKVGSILYLASQTRPDLL